MVQTRGVRIIDIANTPLRKSLVRYWPWKLTMSPRTSKRSSEPNGQQSPLFVSTTQLFNQQPQCSRQQVTQTSEWNSSRSPTSSLFQSLSLHDVSMIPAQSHSEEPTDPCQNGDDELLDVYECPAIDTGHVSWTDDLNEPADQRRKPIRSSSTPETDTRLHDIRREVGSQ